MSRMASNGVHEYQLSNGLGILLLEDHTAPIASVWTWYRVGSRNELPGKTGVSHWVEHMQFKGTPTIDKGQIFRDVARVGGTLNALTSQDWTAYFETLPIEHLDLAFAIEADRMSNSLFDQSEVESERTVILSERQGAENNPAYSLYEEVNGTAFQAHPYRHMVIGYEADLRQLTREDLYDHYRRFYHPANAFVVAVGAFDAHQLVQQIDNRFGQLPAGAAVPRDIGVTEPSQPGERRVLIRKPAGAPYLRMGFHAPPAGDADLVPLLVVEAILSGGQPMGFGGGGSMGRSSRLYRALVASGIARSANSDTGITIDPYLFQIGVTSLPSSDLAVVERIVEDELERLQTELVSQPELERAKRQLEAQFIYSSEGVTNQAYWLGQWEIVDKWSRAVTLPSEIRDVSAERVRAVAERYLQPDRRTVGWLVPADGVGSKPEATNSAPASLPSLAWGLGGPLSRSLDQQEPLQRATLSNGIPVLGQDRPGSQSVAMRVRIPAGAIWEPAEELGVAFLTARSTLRGSGGQTFEEINRRSDDLGSSISVDAGRQFVEARVRCLRADLAEMASLLAQVLLLPSFSAPEVDRVKAEQLGAISESETDTRAVADLAMRRSVYPVPNPMGRRVLGMKETVSGLDADDARRFHARAFTPRETSVAIVGGLGGFDRAIDLLEQTFGSWTAPFTSRTPLDTSPMNVDVVRTTDRIAGKSQADLAIGLATIPRGHNDYYALDVANLVLGRLGLMGRLGAEVRDRQGLAYYASSQLEPRVDGSLWSARAGVAPANVDRALAAMHSELDRLRSQVVTDEELRDAKSYLVGVLPLALETHDGVAATLLGIEEFGLGLDFLERYPGIIGAISPEEVLEAAQHHLDPSRLAIAIAMPSDLKHCARALHVGLEVDQEFVRSGAQHPTDRVASVLGSILVDVSRLVPTKTHFP